MGKDSLSLNPMLAYNKSQKKKQRLKNKVERSKNRQTLLEQKTPEEIDSEIQVITSKERRGDISRNEIQRKKILTDAFQHSIKKREEEKKKNPKSISTHDESTPQIPSSQSLSQPLSSPSINENKTVLSSSNNLLLPPGINISSNISLPQYGNVVYGVGNNQIASQSLPPPPPLPPSYPPPPSAVDPLNPLTVLQKSQFIIQKSLINPLSNTHASTPTSLSTNDTTHPPSSILEDDLSIDQDEVVEAKSYMKSNLIPSTLLAKRPRSSSTPSNLVQSSSNLYKSKAISINIAPDVDNHTSSPSNSSSSTSTLHSISHSNPSRISKIQKITYPSTSLLPTNAVEEFMKKMEHLGAFQQ